METRPMRQYNCKNCGAPFLSRGYHVFYCEACRKEKRKETAANAYRKTYQPKKQKTTSHICPVCHKIFKAAAKQQYCSISCAEFAARNIDLIADNSRKVDSITLRLPEGSREVLLKCKDLLEIPSVNELIKTALVAYLAEQIVDPKVKDELAVISRPKRL